MENQSPNASQDGSAGPLDVVGRLRIEPSIPEDGFECYWIVDEKGQQVGCINGPQSGRQEAIATTIVSLREQVERLKRDQMKLIAQLDAREEARATAAESRVSVLEGALEDVWQATKRHALKIGFDHSKPTAKELQERLNEIQLLIEATRSLPVNAGSTSSDCGVEGHANDVAKLSHNARRIEDGAAAGAGIKPGPSETLSPDTARVADREAMARIIADELDGYISVSEDTRDAKAMRITDLILSKGGTRTEDGGVK